MFIGLRVIANSSFYLKLLLAIHAHSTYSMYIREKITSTSDRRPQSVTNPWVNKSVTNLAQFFFSNHLCSIIIHEPFKLVIEELLKSILVCYKTHNKLARTLSVIIEILANFFSPSPSMLIWIAQANARNFHWGIEREVICVFIEWLSL